MKVLFVFLDVLVGLLASVLAVQSGSALAPNVLVFVLVFALIRSLMLWLFFGSFIHRQLPWLRNTIQILVVLLVLPFVLALLSASDSFALLSSQPIFYYTAIPATIGILSIVFQLFFKLESWQA